MTVIIGKKSFVLGWEAGVAIVLFLVVTTWKFSAFTIGVVDAVSNFKTYMVVQSKKDSLYEASMANDKVLLTKHDTQIDSLKREFTDVKTTKIKSHSAVYYTQQVVNGQTIWHKGKTSNN